MSQQTKTGEELKQAQSSSRQWSQMRSLIAKTNEDVVNSHRNGFLKCGNHSAMNI